MKLTTWKNCYDNQWQGLIVPEAFSHPAKFSPGLIQKIYSYGLENGWFAAGDVIGDPFGGICGGGIFAAFAKLQWIGLELEAKFVDLAKQNIELHRPTWEAHGYPVPVVLQGDSRRFSEIVGKCAAICTSPPFVDSLTSKDEKFNAIARPGRTDQNSDYGQTPGQIGKLKAGDLKAIVTSPPYADSEQSRDGDFVLNSTGVNPTPRKLKTRSYFPAETDNPANIGKLSAVVTSPPFEKQQSGGGIGKALRGEGDYPWQFMNRSRKGGSLPGYMCQGNSDGQIADEKDETYWSACRQVYSECHKALKPGGHMIVVVKAYVKNKKRVPLPQQTLKLLIHLGFEPIERIKAMLTKESVNAGLFGKDIISKKERKSFFRRLAESKGSPKIDFEEILVVRK